MEVLNTLITLNLKELLPTLLLGLSGSSIWMQFEDIIINYIEGNIVSYLLTFIS